MVRSMAMAAILLASCVTSTGPWIVTSVPLTNDDGHVIGRRDFVENRETKEKYSNYKLFEPVKNERGEIVAYEEKIPDGTIRYAPNGRRIGGMFRDLRSGSAFGVVVRPEAE